MKRRRAAVSEKSSPIIPDLVIQNPEVQPTAAALEALAELLICAAEKELNEQEKRAC